MAVPNPLWTIKTQQLGLEVKGYLVPVFKVSRQCLIPYFCSLYYRVVNV